MQNVINWRLKFSFPTGSDLTEFYKRKDFLMKAVIDKATFISGLYMPSKVSSNNSNIHQMLSNIQLDFYEDGRIVCKATDISSSVISEINGEVLEPGKVIVHGKVLYEQIYNMPNDKIQLSSDDSTLNIKCKGSEMNLNTMEDSDFVSVLMPDESEFKTFESTVFSELIQKTAYSVSNDDSKPHIMGIFLIFKDHIAKAVSTDGHKMSIAEYAYEGEFELPDGVILPKNGAMNFKTAIDSSGEILYMAHDPENKIMAIKVGNLFLTSKLIDSVFPPYEKVIPKYEDNKMVVPKAAFLQSLKRIYLLSGGSEAGVLFHLSKDNLKMEGINTAKGSIIEELEVDYQGDELDISFNIKFLDSIINRVDGEEFIFKFGDSSKAGVVITPVDNTSFMAVLMPLKIL